MFQAIEILRGRRTLTTSHPTVGVAQLSAVFRLASSSPSSISTDTGRQQLVIGMRIARCPSRRDRFGKNGERPHRPSCARRICVCGNLARLGRVLVGDGGSSPSPVNERTFRSPPMSVPPFGILQSAHRPVGSARLSAPAPYRSMERLFILASACVIECEREGFWISISCTARGEPST